MNSRKRTVYLLAIALVATACGRERVTGPMRDVVISRSWPAANIHQLRVIEVSGTVKVEATQTDQISLVAEVHGRGINPKPELDNQGLFQTSIDGDTLSIGRREKRNHRRHFNFFFFDRKRVRINYVLKVPATVSLDMKTVNGRIVTRGMSGATEATSVNGTIDVEVTGTESLRASTVNGRVRAKFTKDFQGAQFKSVNGGVEAFLPSNASFSVDLAQVNGDFEASFPLSIHSQPGSRRVSGEVNGGLHRLKIVTVNGDVELSKLADEL